MIEKGGFVKWHSSSVLLPLAGLLLLIGVGGWYIDKGNRAERKRIAHLREENDRLLEEVTRLRDEVEVGFEVQTEEAVQRQSAEASLAETQVTAAATGEIQKNRNEELNRLLRKKENENEKLRTEVEQLALRLNQQEISARAQRREDLVDTEFGTLTIEGKIYEETELVKLDAATAHLRHKGGIERFLIERLPERLRERLVYHPEEAQAHLAVLAEETRNAIRATEDRRIAAKKEADRMAAVQRETAIKKEHEDYLYQVAKLERAVEQWKNAPAKGAAVSRNKQKVEALSKDLRWAQWELSEFENAHGLGKKAEEKK